MPLVGYENANFLTFRHHLMVKVPGLLLLPLKAMPFKFKHPISFLSLTIIWSDVFVSRCPDSSSTFGAKMPLTFGSTTYYQYSDVRFEQGESGKFTID